MAAEAQEFMPPPQPGLVRAVALAFGGHLLLLTVIGFEVNWTHPARDRPAMRAELWAESGPPTVTAPRELQRLPRRPARLSPPASFAGEQAPAAKISSMEGAPPAPAAESAARPQPRESASPVPAEPPRPTEQAAIEAAEIALRHCESAVDVHLRSGGTEPLPEGMRILEAESRPRGEDPANWDGNPHGYVFVLPLEVVNHPSMNDALPRVAFQRPPECMVERVATHAGEPLPAPGAITFLITARGFGPDVQDDPTRGRPTGTEVWLQAVVDIVTAARP